LSNSSLKLIWIRGEINSEAMLWNLPSLQTSSLGSKQPTRNRTQDIEDDWQIMGVQDIRDSDI